MIKAYFSWQNFKQLEIRMRLDYKQGRTCLSLHFPLSSFSFQIHKKRWCPLPSLQSSTLIISGRVSQKPELAPQGCLYFLGPQRFWALNTYKDTQESLSTEVLVCVSWTFKPDVRLVWSLAEGGRQSKTGGQRGRGRLTKVHGFEEVFQPCLFSPAQQWKRDSQHSHAPLTDSTTTDSSFTARERESCRGRDRWTHRESAKTLQGGHIVHKQKKKASQSLPKI